jgi:nucleotide-binding universal stress UspA family protein
MLTFRNILFPVDFSESCVAAAPYFAALARKFNSSVTLMHALGAYDGLAFGADPASIPYAVAYESAIRQRRTAEFEAFGIETFKGLDVKRVVEMGEPGHEIARYANENGIDLITMPTHGVGRFRRMLLGSVTSKVLHDAHCAVWTTAHSEQLTPEVQHIDSIICAVDTYSHPVELIRSSAALAAEYGAQVHLVHAIESPDFGRGVLADTPFQRFLFDTATRRMADLQAESQTNFTACVKPGRVADVVREYALESRSQLILIGRGRIHEFFMGRLRTHVTTIIHDAPCPVLSV